ncbi:MAG: class I SAM-dependent methyltransferase [Crocinitomicaceae bacterium]
MNIFFEYIKYRWIAKGLQGIHSPFVFNFIKDGMSAKLSKESKESIFTFAFKNKMNSNVVNVEDHGAKSKKLKNSRKVKQIFRTSSSFGKNGMLLFRLCHHFKPKNILELGTSVGMGSLYMHFGNPKSKIITIEGCPETYALAKENLSQYPISLINNTFEQALKEVEVQKFDLIFIDGHHDGVALKRYIDILEQYAHDDTLFVLDDIRWSQSMFDSWDQLKSSDTYNLSMDFFGMGVLIKRPQQVKENFILKLKK